MSKPDRPESGGAVSDVLRAALVAEPSLAAIAEAADVSLSSLSRFASGARDSLHLGTVDALASALGFKLVPTRRRAAGGEMRGKFAGRRAARG